MITDPYKLFRCVFNPAVKSNNAEFRKVYTLWARTKLLNRKKTLKATVYAWPCAVLNMMYHFNPSFFETATILYNAVVVPECLRSLIKLFN